MNFSILVDTPATATTPEFILRSRETLGVSQVESSPSFLGDGKVAFLGSISATISVFVFMLLGIRATKGKLAPILGPISDRPNNLFYISAYVGVPELSRFLQKEDERITYLHMADLLFASGMNADAEKKEVCILGLKSLLLIEPMAKSSKDSIKDNLQTLEGPGFSEDDVEFLLSISTNITDRQELRGKIRDIFSDKSNFFAH